MKLSETMTAVKERNQIQVIKNMQNGIDQPDKLYRHLRIWSYLPNLPFGIRCVFIHEFSDLRTN